MKLLIDAGNRHLKWAETCAGDALDGACGALELDGANETTELLASQFAPLEKPASVWVSCVARPQTRQAIADYARDAWSLKPVFIASPKQQCGVVNGYLQPASLGSDRWAALVAARHLFAKQAVIVIDAGTAVTVDLLDRDGVFRGGVIFPGVRVMRSALNEQTENIENSIACFDTNTNEVNPTATDTGTAVAGGALLAVAGGIDLAVARQRKLSQSECRVIATGGDAGQIAPLLNTGIVIKPNLVLRGLAVIAAEPSG